MNDVQARRVMRVLTAGFPTYPFESDTAELYERSLVADVEDGSLALEVAVDWVATRITFPKVAELVDECRAETTRRFRRARAIAVAQAKTREGMVACQRCQDTKMVETVTDDGTFATPCPDCQPEDYQYWAGGHYASDHRPELCDNPRCKLRAKRGEPRIR